MTESINTWPKELDAMIAAPNHHELLFENEYVRVLKTHIRPGETAPVHTHPYPASLHILSWSHILRKDGSGNVLTDSRLADTQPQVGAITWTGPMGPHSVENVGDQDLVVIATEIKPL
jgi:quercetin dioxygenase-like cupin family protein